MDEYQWHGHGKQSYPTERGAYSSCCPRYPEFPPRKELINSGRTKRSSYTVFTEESQALNSRCFALSLSTDNSVHPSRPIVHSPHGCEPPQTFPYNRGISADYSYLQQWNFWNLCYASQTQPEAWYPGLCSIRADRNSRDGLEFVQNAGRQEPRQSLTHGTGHKPRARWPVKFNNQLTVQPKINDGLSHRRLATYTRRYDGVRSQVTNTLNVLSNTQVKAVESCPHLSDPDVTQIFHSFMEKLSMFPVKESSVQTIENCITSSHLPLKTSFVVDKALLQNQSRPVFSGTLYINEIFIASVSCHGKKLLKQKVYDAALHVLKNTSAQQILTQSDLQQRLQLVPQKTTLAIDKKSVNQADEEMLLENAGLIKTIRKKVSKSRDSMTICEQAECLRILIQDLKMSTCDGASIVLTIDKKCIQMSMKLLTVYKIVIAPGQQTIITCDLYIFDCFIAQGQGSTRKKAQTEAYLKGGNILKQSRGREVLFSFPKFNEKELSKPEIFDVVYKGYTKVYESNRCRLNRLKQLPAQKRKISELVIIEHEDWAADRKKHSHCILNQSATQCGCLLEWTIEPENDFFRCTMRLQGEEICSVLARQRKTSLRMASCIALFRMYETQPVIQGFHLDHPQVWITREKLIQHLEFSLGKVEELSDDQAGGNQEVDKNMARAIEEMLDQFFSCATVEEFVAAPDWKPEEKKLLRTLAISKGLRVLTDVYCDDRLPIISQKFDLSEMVRVLENQANRCQGRYRLLPIEERPSYNDIAGEVAANESIIHQWQTSARDGHHFRLPSKVAEDEEENTSDNDLSWFSEDDNLYQTANSTFSYSVLKDKLNTTTQQNSVTVLQTRTSTPVKHAVHVSTLIVDEYKYSTNESRRRNYAKCLSPTADCFNGECSQPDSKPPKAVAQTSLGITSSTECNINSPSKTPSLSTLVVHNQQIKVARSLYSAMIEDSNQDQTEGVWPLPEIKAQQRKFNQSVDLEAGVIERDQVLTDQCKQEDQHFTTERCIELQQQWVEQEY